MVAADGGFFDRSIYPLNLSVGPRMIDLGKPVLDIAFPAAHIEHLGDVADSLSFGVTRRKPELDAVVVQTLWT